MNAEGHLHYQMHLDDLCVINGAKFSFLGATYSLPWEHIWNGLLSAWLCKRVQFLSVFVVSQWIACDAHRILVWCYIIVKHFFHLLCGEFFLVGRRFFFKLIVLQHCYQTHLCSLLQATDCCNLTSSSFRLFLGSLWCCGYLTPVSAFIVTCCSLSVFMAIFSWGHQSRWSRSPPTAVWLHPPNNNTGNNPISK